MTTQHGLNVTVESLSPIPPATTGSTLCVLGTSTAGTKTAGFGSPVAVATLAEAQAAFGTAGTIVDAAKRFFAINSGRLVGILWDASLSSTALQNSKNAAIDAVAGARNTGFFPNLVVAGGLFRNAANDGSANAELSRLKPIAKRQDMFVVADTDDASIAIAKTYADANKDENVALVYNKVTASGVTNLDGSVALACEMVANDAEFGIDESPSNRYMRDGVTAVSPTLTFSIEDDDLQAGDLDSKGVTSFVRDETGFKVWGGLTDYASTDVDLRLIGNARLVNDIIRYDVKQSFNRLIGRRITESLERRTCQDVVALLQIRKADEQIRSGSCRFKRSITPAQRAAGTVGVDLSIGFYPTGRKVDISLLLRTL